MTELEMFIKMLDRARISYQKTYNEESTTDETIILLSGDSKFYFDTKLESLKFVY